MNRRENPRDFGWMRVVLAFLFDRCSNAEIAAALRDPIELSKFRARIEREALAGDALVRIPAGEYGDNLLQAVMALRLKFERAEAEQKLEFNLAARQPRA